MIMRRGITVINLLIVIVVVLGLLSLLVPLINNTRRAAARMSCSNNLRQLGMGIDNYHDTHDQYPSGTVPDTTLPPDQRLNFHVQVLPYIEQNNLFNVLNLKESWDSPSNMKHAPSGGGCYGFYRCPDWSQERGYGIGKHASGGISVTNYVGVAGVGAEAASRPAKAPDIGIFGYDRTLKNKDVKDGLANTMMLIETASEVGPWLRGGPSTVRGIEPTGGQLAGDGLPFGGTHFRQAWIFQSPRPAAFHILLADGSVRQAKNAIDPNILTALATVAGGEVIPAGW